MIQDKYKPTGPVIDPDVVATQENLTFKWIKYVIYMLDDDKREKILALYDLEYESKNGVKGTKTRFFSWNLVDASAKNKSM
ncbi:uncharacterized protein BCR38DRAFT_489511 [Pseudomassariella vexata]|uniref:Uncharacterized protein n=1 Tax=Pseudomassariella vexata TaxID=1141098 RepID=A0A1Y2DG08_9PEZI|nr:uncharacterized protein BCR38DRAFT_489511 [Pseudomassariella vexata]ORY58024.1 hypothetical protein BCR38DRAFT_489511 [Pseudomassariella vexata]